jgi:hypothetical protein
MTRAPESIARYWHFFLLRWNCISGIAFYLLYIHFAFMSVWRRMRYKQVPEEEAQPVGGASNIAIAAFIISIAAAALGIASLTVAIINAVRISRLQKNNTTTSSSGVYCGQCPSCDKLEQIQTILNQPSEAQGERGKKEKET